MFGLRIFKKRSKSDSVIFAKSLRNQDKTKCINILYWFRTIFRK